MEWLSQPISQILIGFFDSSNKPIPRIPHRFTKLSARDHDPEGSTWTKWIDLSCNSKLRFPCEDSLVSLVLIGEIKVQVPINERTNLKISGCQTQVQVHTYHIPTYCSTSQNNTKVCKTSIWNLISCLIWLKIRISPLSHRA